MMKPVYTIGKMRYELAIVDAEIMMRLAKVHHAAFSETELSVYSEASRDSSISC